MKNIKNFESFDMRRDICDRCQNPTNNTTTQSMFNEQVICMSCKDEERKDPEYKAAEEAEREALRNGDRNFRGAMPDYKP
jgi:predicted sulfurtransferase